MKDAFGGVFDGVPVLVTGHTGFKGSWLSVWLKELGARVIGYSLDPPTVPSNFGASRLAGLLVDVRNDVRKLDALQAVIEERVHSVDFAPTVAALLGIAAPEKLDGVDRSALMTRTKATKQ